MSKAEEIKRDFLEAVKNAGKTRTEGYDTTAMVSSIENGTAWVRIPGSTAETPVELSINANEGDTVQLRVAGGRAWITGNNSAPPTDDARANTAIYMAEEANEDAEAARIAAMSATEAAETAQARADDAALAAAAAQSSADAAQGSANTANTAANNALMGLSTVENVVDIVNWFADHKTATTDTTVNPNKVYYIYDASTGVLTKVDPVGTENPSAEGWYEMTEAVAEYVSTHVATTSDGLSVVGSANGWRVLISAGGGNYAAGIYLINPSGEAVASFGTTTQIGKTGESRIVQDYHSFKMIDMNGNEYVSLEDLRSASGTANFKVLFIGDGSTKEFTLAVPATNTSYTVTVSDSSGGTVTKATNKVTFSTAPTSEAEITVTYVTTSELAKAFTFGSRDSSANTGGLSFAEGYNVAPEGSYSHAEGYMSNAIGMNSHAEGQQTTAAGVNSHAEGRGTTATGHEAHAEGLQTTAYTDAHAEGALTQALTGASHAEGYFTTASGYDGAHSEGYNTVASGDRSHAQNEWTIAAKYAQTALGRCNVADTASGDYGKYAAIIGNGTSDSARSNAFAFTWAGDTEFECKSGDALYTAINAAGWLSEVTA